MSTSPEIEVVSHADGDVVPFGEPLQLQAQVNDNEDAAEEIVVWWEIDGEQVCPPLQWAFGLSTCNTVLEQGPHFIEAFAEDTTGQQSTAALELTTEPYDALTVEIVSPSQNSLWYSGQTVTFTGVVTGALDDGITFSWTSSRDGPIEGGELLDEYNASNTSAVLSMGDHQIIFSGHETNGVVHETAVTLSVIGENTPPSCDIISPIEGTVWVGNVQHTLEGTANDNEVPANSLTYTWVSDLDGALESALVSSSGVISTNYALSSGVHQLTLQVDDEVGARCEVSTEVVVNTNPIIQIDSPTNNQLFQSGDIIGLMVSGDDNEDGPAGLSVSVRSDVSGDLGIIFLDLNGQSYTELLLQTGIHTIEVTATDSHGFSSIASTLITVNTPPTAPSVSISPDPAYTIDDLTALASNSFDLEGAPIVYTYNWYLNGAQTSLTGSTIPSLQTQKGESWRVVVQAFDGYTYGPSTEATVVIQNSPPVVTNVNISPSQNPHSQDTLTCTADIVDPDGVPTVQYNWLDDGLVIASGQTIDLSNYTVLPESTLSCSVGATDVEGLSTAESVDVVIQNTPPVITGIGVAPDPIFADSVLTCASTVTDIDTNPISISTEWSHNGISVGSGATVSLDPSWVSVSDTITCEIQAEDFYGGLATDYVDIVVQNTPPTINQITILPQNIFADSVVECQIDAVDLNDSMTLESFVWENLTTGQLLGSTAILDLDASLAAPSDTIRCLAEILDSNGASVSASATAVIENTLPVIIAGPNISPSSGVKVETQLSCSVSATDLDDGVPNWSYVWFVDGLEVSTGTGFVPTESTTDVGSVVSCFTEIYDNHGGYVSGETNVILENTVPIMSDVVITPNSAVTTSSVLDCLGSGDDADADPLSFDYAWHNQTTGQSLGSGSSITLSPAVVSPMDEITCTSVVTDVNGANDFLSGSVSITNSGPVIGDLIIVPDLGVTTNSDLLCAVLASDPDNDSLTTSFQWTKGNVFLGSSESLQLTPAIVQPLDILTCTATVVDAHGLSDTETVTIGVENSLPVVSGVLISPDPIFNDSSLACLALANDPDGQAVTQSFFWRNLSTAQDLGLGSNVTLSSSHASVGDTIECSVTVVDPNGGIQSMSSEAIVQNRAPNVVSMNITPDEGITSSSALTCSSSAEDQDDESLTTTYEWYLGGQQIGSGSTISLSPLLVQPGDSIGCHATVSDLSGATDIDQSTVVVENINPVVSTVDILPATAFNDSTLTCDATGSDADGQSFSASYIWQNNGVVLSTNSSLTLSHLTALVGDTISCTATLTDVSGGTDSETTTVTVANRSPVVASIGISPPDPTSISTLVCSASGVDSDHDALTLSYFWENQSTGVALGASSVITLTPAVVQPGDNISCTASVVDSSLAIGSAVDSVVVGNTDPVVSSVNISPTPAHNDSTLDCVSVSADADNQSITTTYEWTNGGNYLGVGASLTLSSFVSSVGDLISCTATATDQSGGQSSQTTSIQLSNRSPIVSSVAITPNTNTFIGTTLTCSGVGADPDDDVVSLNFSWVRGVTLIGTGDSLTLDSTIVQPGDSVDCVVTVSDPSGFTDSQTAAIIVNNTSPELSSVDIVPSQFYNDSTLSCDIVASDLDDQPLTTVYNWTNGGNPIGNNANLTLIPSIAMPGDSILCSVSVTDTSGASVTLSSNAFVQNRAPTVSMPTLSSSSPTLGSLLGCFATGSDPDFESINIDYDWYLGSVSGQPVHSGDSLNFLSSGTPQQGQVLASVGDDVICVATASDPTGATDSAQGTVTIVNSPPVVNSVTIGPDPSYNDSLLVCSVTASDADAHSLATDYSWSNGSVLLATTPTLSLDSSMASVGDIIRCTVTVTDTHGAAATDFVEQSVGNRSPLVDVPLIAPADPTLGTTIHCSGSATDPDNQSTSLSYAWFLGNPSGAPVHTGDSLEILATGVATVGQVIASVADDVFCVLTATDPNGAVGSGESSVIVGNAHPIVSNIDVIPDPSYNDSTLSCLVTASDSDAQSLSTTHSWTNGSVVLGTGETLTLNPSMVLVGDLVRCTATVTDGFGGFDTTFGERVIGNRSPVLDPPVISPTNATLGGTLTCGGSATDPDNHSVTLSYDWYLGAVSGSPLHSGSSIDLLAVGTPGVGQVLATVGEMVFCQVSATDSFGAISTADTVVEINNTPPSISSVVLTPTQAYNNSDLLCSVSASDSDQQLLTTTYSWTNGNAVLGTSQMLTLTSAMASVGDGIRCTATVVDPSGGTDTSFSEQVLGNRSPNIPVSSINPSLPTTGSVVTCNANATDPDNQALGYTHQWYVNDTNTPLFSGADLQLVPLGPPSTGQAMVRPGDTVYCQSTATDGILSSVSGLASVTVENTQPTISTVVLSPSTGVFNDSSLSCSHTAFDVDHDPITESFEWRNQTLGTILGAGSSIVLSPSTVDSGDVIACSVTVSDTNGGSSTLDAILTLDNRSPLISSISLNPVPQNAGDIVSCQPIASDPDGDSVNFTYEWHDGGSVIANGQAYTTSMSDVGQTISCIVTASDGDMSDTRDSIVDGFAIEIDQIIADGTTLTLPSGTYDFDTLQVKNGGTLVIEQGATLFVDSVLMDATSSITGNAAAANGGVTAGDAVGDGGSLYSPNEASGGGGYGGDGGDGGADNVTNTSFGGASFGTVDGPDISSGGGSAGVSCESGAHGGSHIELNILSDAEIAGDITMRGGNGVFCSENRTSGGGAGGGILIRNSHNATLDFTGNLSAVGGDGGLCTTSNCDGGGGGGGGRIKILGFTSFQNLSGTYDVAGGIGGVGGNADGEDGLEGTFFIENAADGTVMKTDTTWVGVSYEVCPGNCSSTEAKATCIAVGKKLASHASDGNAEVFSLGANSSCQHSVSYFSVNSPMPVGSCLVGVSNLDWSGCCSTSEWHGQTLPFASPGSVFGYVDSNDSGHVAAYTNSTNGTNWGCYSTSNGANQPSICTSRYVACVD